MNTLAPASPRAALPAPTIRQNSNPTFTTRILLAPIAHSVYLHRLCGADKRVMFCTEGALSRLGEQRLGAPLLTDKRRIAGVRSGGLDTGDPRDGIAAS